MSLKTEIAVVDNHPLVRHAISKFINELSDRFTVSIEKANGLELARALRQIAGGPVPQIVLMDLNMPSMDGYQTTLWLKKHYPEIKVIILTTNDDQATIIRLVKTGVCGYLNKNIEADELFKALAIVGNGGTYFKTLDMSLVTAVPDIDPILDTWYSLSEKERQFVRLCASDLEDVEILQRVGIRPWTTEPYARKIYSKFDVKTRVGLVMLMARYKLFSIDGE